MKSVKSALTEAVTRLATDHPRLDADVLLAHALNVPRSWISAHPAAQISPADYARYNHSIELVSGGTPLPYVVGHWEFYGLDFKLDSRALIPRPETELLVEQALSLSGPGLSDIRIADIGTGAGIIAITLALNLPQAEIIATDISARALALAQENAVKHRVADRISFAHLDLMEGLGRFDLICANPPYVCEEELETLPSARYEPRLALNGGADGMHTIERFLASASDHLRTPGILLMEIGATQGVASLALAREAFSTGTVQLVKDLAGLDRLLIVWDQ